MTAYLLEDIWHMFWGNWSRRRNAEELNSRVLKVEITESLGEIDLASSTNQQNRCYHGKFEICRNCRKQG